MELEFVGLLSSLGTGGVLAFIMFMVYRREKNATESRLSGIIDRDIETREKHTEALVELTTFLKTKNGN
jgi:hypothetical protein